MDPAARLSAGAARLRASIAEAAGPGGLAAVAQGIAALAGEAIDDAADVAAITSTISALNDEVTGAVVHAVAAEMAVDLSRACWLVFGSQARGEQTIATDQDNGLVFAPEGDADANRQRPDWMRFGQRVNEALAECGYPLCDGRVMAGQPLCCLTAAEWCRRFEHWMSHGSGNDLLAVRIYFDLRALSGNTALARPIVDLLASPAAAVPRFVKQMADVVLCNHVPLNWWGAVVAPRDQGRPTFDLKMSGTALFVDAARLWSLAHGIGATGTSQRLTEASRAMRVPASELAQWLQGFHTLQGLRLQLQRHRPADEAPARRCLVPWDALDEGQRRALKQSLRAARWIQRRIELDYRR